LLLSYVYVPPHPPPPGFTPPPFAVVLRSPLWFLFQKDLLPPRVLSNPPSPTLFLHLPRSHYENPACPHWLRCLDVSQKAMPVIQLCALAPDITGLNSLTCFPLYLIGMVWLQEWRLRGDRLGSLRNSIEFCSLVLQKLSERWASAGMTLPPSVNYKT